MEFPVLVLLMYFYSQENTVLVVLTVWTQWVVQVVYY